MNDTSGAATGMSVYASGTISAAHYCRQCNNPLPAWDSDAFMLYTPDCGCTVRFCSYKCVAEFAAKFAVNQGEST